MSDTTPDVDPLYLVQRDAIGAANGVAGLDENRKVLAENLPTPPAAGQTAAQVKAAIDERFPSGAGVPSAAPKALGALYTRTATGDAWRATGTASVADWKPLVTIEQVQSAATPVDTTYALGRWLGGLRTRDTQPCPIFGAGSSTTAGQAATAEEKRYFNRLVASIQAAFPLASGAAQPATKMSSAATSSVLSAGIQGVNYGKGGTESKDFITTADVTQMVAQSSTKGIAMPFLMFGSNDWSHGIPVATFKTNTQNWVNTISNAFAAAGKPFVIVLAATYGRLNSSAVPTAPATGPVAAWSEYVKAMREVAIANLDKVAFLDLSETYRAAGVPNETASLYDPFDLISTDEVHQTDAGHEFMADELRKLLRVPKVSPAGSSTTPTTPAPAWSILTSDSWSGAAATTIEGRKTDATLGGVPLDLSTATGSAFGLNGTGALVPGGTRVSVETVGVSVGKTSMAMEFTIQGLSGGSVWLDVRASSTATSTIGTYRLQCTTGNTIQLQKRPSGGVSQNLGAAVPIGTGAWGVARRLRVEVSDVAEGVLLKAFMDGVEVASYTDTTSPITTGTFGRITTTSVASYQIDQAIWSVAV